jgi:hypothetical protein
MDFPQFGCNVLRLDRVCFAMQIPGKWWLVSQLWQHVAATQGRDTVRMALDNTDMLLVQLLLGAEAFLLVHFAGFTDSQHRCGYINVCVCVCVCVVCVCVMCVLYVCIVCVLCVCVVCCVCVLCVLYVCVLCVCV